MSQQHRRRGAGPQLPRTGAAAALRAVSAGLLLLAGRPPCASATEPCPRLEMFSRADCPHCERAREFLAQLAATQPGLEIRIADVDLDPGARERLRELGMRHRVQPIGVPAFLVCDTWSASTGPTGRRAPRSRRDRRA
jgi:glutaredoxin